MEQFEIILIFFEIQLNGSNIHLPYVIILDGVWNVSINKFAA